MSIAKSLSSRHFFPKFDNLNSKEVDPLQLMTPADVLLFTKKHSGSLILVHSVYMDGEWQLIVNSKNGICNEFSITAEHYFRYQFDATFPENGSLQLLNFANYIGENSFTFCFEFVTDVLGNHGDHPKLPYAVLTSISQFDDVSGQSRFASLPEIVDLACKFRLILNEMWVVGYDKAVSASTQIRSLRWTGLDRDFTACLDSCADFKVNTMLPHSEGQGKLLEGMVVQVVRTSTDTLHDLHARTLMLNEFRPRLIQKLNEFKELIDATSSGFRSPLQSYCPPNETHNISNVREFFELHSRLIDHGEEKLCRTPLQEMFYYLSQLPQPELKLFALKDIHRGNNISVIVHVLKDQMFFSYADRKPVSASPLYRGFEIFLAREFPPSSTGRQHDINAGNEMVSSAASSMATMTINESVVAHDTGACDSVAVGGGERAKSSWEIITISKWKNWEYLKRTFCLRNGLSFLFRQGLEAFISHAVKQFQNWGLLEKYHVENLSLVKAWGLWLLNDPEIKTIYLRSSHNFRYLYYLDQFLPKYESHLLIGDTPSTPRTTSGASARNIALMVYCFQESLPEWLLDSKVLQGFSIVTKDKQKVAKSRKLIVDPGQAYVFTLPSPPNTQEILVPHMLIVIPPTDMCLDRGLLKMFDTFQFQLQEHPYLFPVCTIRNTEDAAAAREAIGNFDKSSKPTHKFLLAMVAMPPGCGKSTLATALVHEMERNNSLRVRMISSDEFGMRMKAGSGNAKAAFEAAVVDALRDINVDVVVYDKNIPNIDGYHCMQSVCARAGLSSLTIIQIVPSNFGQEEGKTCISRVLNRPVGSHTLTKGSVINGYASPAEFMQSVFISPCIHFGPVAKLLPNACLVDGLFDSIVDASSDVVAQARDAEAATPMAVHLNAVHIIDKILQLMHPAMTPTIFGAESVSPNAPTAAGLDLTRGRYLALCFHLDAATQANYASILRVPVRQECHITIVFYNKDMTAMEKAAKLLASLDVAKPIPVTVYRLGLVQGGQTETAASGLSITGIESATTATEEVQEGMASSVHGNDSILAWASIRVLLPGLESIPTHATLNATRCPPVLAKSGEKALLAMDRGEGDAMLDVGNGDGVQLPIRVFQVEPKVYESNWCVCV